MAKGLAQLFLIIAVFAVFLTVYLGLLAVLQREESLETKLRRFTALRTPANSQTEKHDWKDLLRLFGRFAPQRFTEVLDRELVQGDIPLKGGEFLALQGLFTIILGILGLLFTLKFYLGLLFALLGWFVPRLWLKSARKKKHKKFDIQLGDALMILINSIKAGFSLLQAMEMVSQEMTDPLAAEFELTLREMTYGTATETALLHLAERVNSDVLDLLVTAMLIQRQIGGNLAEVLQNIHTTIQGRLTIKQEIKTLTAQGRISGYIIAALPLGIGVILCLISPGYINTMFTHPLGWAMLIAGIVSEGIGFLIIRKIVTIEV